MTICFDYPYTNVRMIYIYIYVSKTKDFKIIGPTGNSENSEPQMGIEPTTLCHLKLDPPTTELLENIC